MKGEQNYMTSQEMRGITHLLVTFKTMHANALILGVSIGEVSVYDANGEELGSIDYRNDEYVFVAAS